MPAWLERHQYLFLVFAALVLVGGVLADSLNASEPAALEFQDGSGLPPGTPIRVHVSGQVVRPSVYELVEGDRVMDAVNMAGGATNEADLEALNLARRLRDGEKLVVPSAGSDGTTTKTAAPPTLVPGELLDINHANAAQLDGLPGIGEAYSRRIVDSRTVDGPFESLDDLAARRVLPASLLESIRPLITVSQ
jgi:competence protein ComEA